MGVHMHEASFEELFGDEGILQCFALCACLPVPYHIRIQNPESACTSSSVRTQTSSSGNWGTVPAHFGHSCEPPLSAQTIAKIMRHSRKDGFCLVNELTSAVLQGHTVGHSKNHSQGGKLSSTETDGGDHPVLTQQLPADDVIQLLDRLRGLTLKFKTFRGAKLQEQLYAGLQLCSNAFDDLTAWLCEISASIGSWAWPGVLMNISMLHAMMLLVFPGSKSMLSQ